MKPEPLVLRARRVLPVLPVPRDLPVLPALLDLKAQRVKRDL